MIIDVSKPFKLYGELYVAIAYRCDITNFLQCSIRRVVDGRYKFNGKYYNIEKEDNE